MFDNISKAMRAEMPVASAVFYGAATLVAGRKFCVAAGYKVCAAVAELTGRENAAEWNKASNESLSLAKKDAIRDVTAVAGFIGLLAVALGTTEAYLLEEEKEKSWPDSIRDNLHYYVVGGSALVVLGIRKYRMNKIRRLNEEGITSKTNTKQQFGSSKTYPQQDYHVGFDMPSNSNPRGQSTIYSAGNFLKTYHTSTGF
jgi:hypothetical protein